ncbi:MAG: type II/IV secretion system ATPase subunit [SAR202 cluster bacterium]|nr:type II/IV secretion system ATPase subunit [SAR202 cluster bacterium]
MAFSLKNLKVIVKMGKGGGVEHKSGAVNGNAVSLQDGIKGFLKNTGIGHSSEFVLDQKLLARLPSDFRDQTEQFRHLGAYVSKLPIDDIGIPEYLGFVSRGSDTQKKRNLLYPVGGGVFIHVVHDPEDTRDYYLAVEPSLAPGVEEIVNDIDVQLMDYIDELRSADGAEGRLDVILNAVDEICGRADGSSKKVSKPIDLTDDQFEAIKYLMRREKAGMGVMDPLVEDPYIEDISCSGVGPLFIEHKVFGGLKANIEFSDSEELDQYVIQLSEKIGRPVTIREPIVDATLPDGSRINIVYGGDVSRRGSNFTIRKFSATPLSILDLIKFGTLTYEMAAYISLMLSEGMNTFVSGETASGKTTILNAISTFIPPNAKIVSIEDTPELQVPHKNWIREVTRGGGENSASITMFDLLVAALRQRPEEIVIGEIRGAEGAIAFQAMQTGHACMATFHAASVEKLIQRLTGNPINVPKTYIDNLNMVVIMSAVRLPDGSPGRRCLSISEIIEYDPESNSFGFIEVFKWNPATDEFEFPGYMNTHLLEQVVASRRGLPPDKYRNIYGELERRAEVLKRLSDRNTTNFYELHNVLAQANREGLF